MAHIFFLSTPMAILDVVIAPEVLYEKVMDWSNAIFHGLLNVNVNQVLALTKGLLALSTYCVLSVVQAFCESLYL